MRGTIVQKLLGQEIVGRVQGSWCRLCIIGNPKAKETTAQYDTTSLGVPYRFVPSFPLF